MKNWIIFSLLMISLNTLHASTNANSRDSILILGDSLSAGYGITVAQSWPVLLQEKVNQKKLNLKIHNASISGQTSAEGLAQIDQLLSLSHPKLVILELGANDGLRGLSISAMQDNLQKIISKSQQAGAKVLLVGIKTPANYGKRYGSMFENSFKLLSKSHGVPLVPFMLEPLFSAKEKYVQKDGLHPNAIAQPLLLEHLWGYIQPQI